MEDLHGGRTGIVAGVEPFLDAGAIVRDAGAEAYGRLHHVHGDWALEEAWNGKVQLVFPSYHFCCCFNTIITPVFRRRKRKGVVFLCVLERERD